MINFDFPAKGGGVEDYVHRIGRTGRAGNTGISYTFMTPLDLRNESAVQELVGVLTRCGQVLLKAPYSHVQ